MSDKNTSEEYTIKSDVLNDELFCNTLIYLMRMKRGVEFLKKMREQNNLPAPKIEETPINEDTCTCGRNL